jgi:hypothetical protein
MQLLGLDGFALALALLLVTAAILLLYLLRRPTRVVLTPALFLWEAVVPERKRASALFSRLRRPLSLLLALAIAALLLLALGDPERARGGGRDVLILIDQSASMAARDVRPSRLERAKERARELVDDLGDRDRALVAAVAGVVTPLTPLVGDRALLRAAIDGVRQTDGAARLAPAAHFALDLLSGRERPELVLLSDGNMAAVESDRQLLASAARIEVHFEPIGSARRNVAITSFSVRHYPLDRRHHESLVGITNFGGTEERVALQIRAHGELLSEQSFMLAADDTVTRTLSELPAGAELLEASIALAAGADALASDDRALVAVPSRARTRVLAVSDGNRYLEAALLLDEYLEVSEVTPAAFRSVGDHEVVIFDRTAPSQPPTTPALYLGAPGAGGAFPLALRGSHERPFFDRVLRDHPLVRGLALADVNIASAASATLAPGDIAIGASARGPLLVEGVRAAVPFLAFTFDVRESDLPLRPAWPLLVLRSIDRLAGHESSSEPVRVAGEPFELRLPHEATSATLVAPDGTRSELAGRGAQRRVVCDRAGAYRVELPGGTAISLAVRVAAESEGAIAPRRELLLSRPSPSSARPAVASAFEGRLWPLLVACALLLALLEWLTFHRRWTV